ncbi:MAG TPA: C4-type zinc ribbon domain-containing protein [Elusimicrobiales bacterium]|nr:C4-type zinc ribbon domain-containing protein [Elusimicrobiales bacterium]
MDILPTTEVKALVELQAMDTALDALAARAAEVPVKIAALDAAFEVKKNSMSAARDALLALQLKKKNTELEIGEADEGIRKHQRDLNAVKDNNAFKALLSEIETCKNKKDELETRVLTLLEEIDLAKVEDARLKEEVKQIEAAKNAEVAGLSAGLKELESRIAAAAAQRAAAAAAITPALVEKYEHLRVKRAGLAVAEAHEELKTGKFSCGGCHMGLTPQKIVDVKKHDAFAICPDCRRLLYLKRTVFG